MSSLFSQDSMAEFFVQSLISHWFVAIVLVALVALFVTSRKSLNATTRHNIWLITLISFMLMPLLVFVPKPSVNINLLEFFTAQKFEPITPQATIQDNTSELIVDKNKPFINKNINNDSNNIASNVETAQINTSVNSNTTKPDSALLATSNSKGLNFPGLVKAIFIFWLIGSLYLVRRLWGEYRAARELELQSDSVTPYFERRFAQLCERLEIKEKPLLRFHAGINAPMTVGLVRVWVAIPMVWREEIDDDIFDQTLTHELGHIARKDPLVNTIQRLLNILFWMYPAVWYVSRQLELERESACDDWVLTHDGKGHTYANNLLNVAESLYLQPHVLAVGCLRSHSQLSRRIQNLLNKSSDHAVKNSWKLLLATTAGLFLTLSASAVMWPSAPENFANEQQAISNTKNVDLKNKNKAKNKWNNTGSAKAVPDTQINFSDKGTQVLLNGVELDNDANPVHDPRVPPVHIPPVRPNVISNYGANGHNYSYSHDDEVSINHIQTTNGKYGSGSLLIKRGKNNSVELEVEPSIKASKSPYLHAAWNNDYSAVKRLLKKGKDINKVYKRPTMPRTALNAAILQGNLEMVEFLHEAGAEFYSRSSRRKIDEAANALSTAAMIGNKPIAKYLIKQGAKADDSTMVIAVQSKSIDLVEYLLKQDIETDEAALVVAVQNRDMDMIDVLLEHGVEVDDSAMIIAIQNGDKKLAKRLSKEVDEIDDAALIVAIQTQNDEMIDWLLKQGVDADDGALVMAVQSGNKSLVKRLLKAGADVDDGALVIAIQSQDNEMIDWLLEAGADPDDGALVMAVQNRNKPLVKRLLKAGADIDDGALIIALQSRDTEMVQWLLDAGADPDDGALIIAIQNRQTKIAKQLLDAGADIDDGALIVAIQSRDRKMVSWLLDAGADVEDGALIVAMQTGDKKIIELIQKNYSGEISSNDKNIDWEDFEEMENYESIASLKALGALEKLGDLEGLEQASQKFGEQLGDEIAAGVVNFIGDMSENGGNVESIALVKALEMDDVQLALDLLNDGAIPNTLHITQALELDNSTLARQLIEKGAVPNSLNVLQALENGENGLAEHFMKKGAKPNGIILLKAMESEDKDLINLIRTYMNENKSEIVNAIENERLVVNQNNQKNYSFSNKSTDFSFDKWPVKGKRISSDYGKSAKRYKLFGKKMHNGIDFVVNKGDAVISVADGVVVKSKYSEGYGNYLVIQHDNGYQTLYANIQSNLVSVGQKVKCKQTIALAGNSGKNSTGPHLHFEVLLNGASQNPHDYLNVSKKTS